jgi:transcriptional regulator with XRE-family HTH domain
MSARNVLTAAPPYPVDRALKQLGANLRRARVRRGLTIAEVAAKIGTGYRAVADAEKGKPSTGIAVYAALLWAFDQLGQLAAVADPSRDSEGQALAMSRERSRARRGGAADNDF